MKPPPTLAPRAGTKERRAGSAPDATASDPSAASASVPDRRPSSRPPTAGSPPQPGAGRPAAPALGYLPASLAVRRGGPSTRYVHVVLTVVVVG